MKFSIIAIAFIALVFGMTSVRADSGAEGGGFVTVRKGDSLNRLSQRHKVPVADLQRWNHDVIGRNDSIRAGDRLRITPPPAASTTPATPSPAKPPPAAAPTQPAWHDHVVVRRGDTARRIARRERVPVDDLLRWNRLGPKSRINAGDRLIVERHGPRPPALSIGRAASGRLENGVWLDRGKGYRLRFPKNAYGTQQVVDVLRKCARAVHGAFPGTADILIGDISRPGGGRFPPHESHQSGRDADVGYYLVNNEQNATMHVVRPDGIDHRKTWALLRCYLRTGTVVRVYIDRRIQKAMADFLRSTKMVTPDTLRRLFETEGDPAALIRHAPHHDTHLHVRFACQSSEQACEQEPNETVWRGRNL